MGALELPSLLPRHVSPCPGQQSRAGYLLSVVYVNANAKDNDQAQGQQDGQGEVPTLQLPGRVCGLGHWGGRKNSKWTQAAPTSGLSQPPALGLDPWLHPSGAWPPAPSLDLAPQPGQAWSPPAPSLTFQFSVVQELLIGHCRERRGRGRGLSQGGKETEERARARWGGWGGWAAQPDSLPSVPSELVFP